MTFKEFNNARRAYQTEFINTGTVIAIQSNDFSIADELAALYVESHDDKASHNCNTCKSFVRRCGNMFKLVFTNGKVEVKTIWDFEAHGEYANVVKALSDRVKHYVDQYANGKGSFKFVIPRFGDKELKSNLRNINFSEKHNCDFTHMWLEIPAKYSDTSRYMGCTESLIALRNTVDSWKVSDVQTVIDNASIIYLYDEAGLKEAIDAIQNKDIPLYLEYSAFAKGFYNVRGHAMGTLVSDIASGKSFEDALKAYEYKTAPSNYQRPKPVMTEKQFNAFKKEISDKGHVECFNREFASIDDIKLRNRVYVNKPNFVASTNIFDDIEKDLKVDPKKYSNATELRYEDLLAMRDNIDNLEMLIESSHLKNFMSISKQSGNANGKSMFKWDNTFAWTYADGLASSAIAKRVKEAGGRVDNVLFRASLSWKGSYTDLDLHLENKLTKTHIFYHHKRGTIDGVQIVLDLDMNGIDGKSLDAVENIYSEKYLPDGDYKLFVHNYSKGSGTDNGFNVEVQWGDAIYHFSESYHPREREEVYFNFTVKNGEIKFEKTCTNTNASIEKWGVSTNKWHKVDMIIESPNVWEGRNDVGHAFFINKEIKNNEPARGFFNQFIKRELIENYKKQFEYAGGKCILPMTDNQCSGIGFNLTERANILVKYQDADGKEQVRKLMF